MVKPWIDPVTRDKMQLLGTDFLPVLREYIDNSNIPVELGGTHENFKWNWPYPEETHCTPEHVAEYNAARGRPGMDKAKCQEMTEGRNDDMTGVSDGQVAASSQDLTSEGGTSTS